MQRLQIARRMFERLAFREAGFTLGNVDDIGAQTKSGELERRPRARARLDKKIHECLAAQRRDLFYLACANLLKCVRCFDDEIDLVGRKLTEAEQIFSCPTRGHRIWVA